MASTLFLDAQRAAEATGLNAGFVKEAYLADFSERSVATTNGRCRLWAVLSAALKIDPASWLEEQLRLLSVGTPLCYQRADVTEQDIESCQRVLWRVAELVERSMPDKFFSMPVETALELRAGLTRDESQHLTFNALCSWCWNCGIPVVHLPLRDYPGFRKPDGAVINLNGRPVVFLCRADKHPAMQLFKLAHELGHVLRGHWREGSMLSDVEIKPDYKNDPREIEANSDALQLVYGVSNFSFDKFARTGDYEYLYDNEVIHHMPELAGRLRLPADSLALAFLHEHPSYYGGVVNSAWFKTSENALETMMAMAEENLQTAQLGSYEQAELARMLGLDTHKDAAA